MGPGSWERSMKLLVTQLQLYLHNKDRFSQDFNIRLSCRVRFYFDVFKIQIVFYGTQVLRTQYESVSDSITIFPTE
jgi:hypothetical protein